MNVRRPVRPMQKPVTETIVNPRRRQVPAIPIPVKPKPSTKKRMYVPDTNVIMHDPSCLFRFQEHDVFITSTVLEELDNNKKGNLEINRNVREFCRTLENIISEKSVNLSTGLPLSVVSGGIASGYLFLQSEHIPIDHGLDKPDNQILAVVANLTKEKQKKCEVVLVSKDINMRIKAKMAGMMVEDYRNDAVIEDTDLLYQGTRELPSDFWNTHSIGKPTKEGNVNVYKVSGPIVKKLSPNEFIYSSEGSERKPFNLRVVQTDGKLAVLHTVHDYTHDKNSVSGICARNREQNFGLNLLMDPNVDLVTFVGKAGSGKTLLTLAAAITQTVDSDIYSEIIFTRVTIPVGEDIGFLPGTEEDKMTPWMGALDDNMDVLCSAVLPSKKFSKGHEDANKGFREFERSDRLALIRSRIKVKSMSFMRGRTFLKKFVIIDEVQNLTAKEVKMLITRAGPGTKIVCLGNLSQIDTPYLTEGSSGLTYLVDRFKDWDHSGHVTLFAGERSRLASHANEVL